MTIKKAAEEIRALVAKGLIKEAIQLHRIVTKADDYDSHSHHCLQGKMFAEGIMYAG